jgi:hypothetical protein
MGPIRRQFSIRCATSHLGRIAVQDRKEYVETSRCNITNFVAG